MTDIIIVASVDENGSIGFDSKIPWRIKEDMVRFRKMTTGFPCIMGSKTYESLPIRYKPLPNRENIVLTRRNDYYPKGTVVCNCFNDAIEYATTNSEKVFIIGGSEVYSSGLGCANFMEITEIYNKYSANVYFPKISKDNWKITNREDLVGKDLVSGKIVSFSFISFKRV